MQPEEEELLEEALEEEPLKEPGSSEWPAPHVVPMSMTFKPATLLVRRRPSVMLRNSSSIKLVSSMRALNSAWSSYWMASI